MAGNIAFPLFSLLSIASVAIFATSSSLRHSAVDLSFYKQSLVNSSNSIEYDNSNSKNLINKNSKNRKSLMRNSFSFLWAKANGSVGADDIEGNGFLMNVMTEDTQYEGKVGIPDWDSPISYLYFLVGTSLSFVSKVFDKVDDFSKEVNDATSELPLTNKTNKTGNSLFISQASISSKNNEEELNEIYRFTSPDIETRRNNNYYSPLEAKNVRLVYAATDLKINKRIIDLNTNTSDPESLVNETLNIKSDDRANINWVDQLENGKNFAMDFCVLKIKVATTKLKDNYLHYLQQLYGENYNLNKLFDGNYNITNNKLLPITIGGWRRIYENAAEHLKYKNLSFHINIKSGQDTTLITKLPSSINDENFATHFELKFFEEIDNVTNSVFSDYESTNLQFNGNDDSGLLIIKYQIKHKTKNIIFPEVFTEIFTTLKSNSSNPPSLTDTLKIDFKTKHENLNEKYNFLTKSPTAWIDWNEFFFPNPHLALNSFHDDYAENVKKHNQEMDNTNLNSSFSIKDKKYVNISHYIEIPNFHLNAFKGALVLNYSWTKMNKDEILGFYDGYTTFKNALSGNKYVGKIAILASPTRYDLLTENNNFSYPSLGDSLRKKNMTSHLIKKNLFKTKP